MSPVVTSHCLYGYIDSNKNTVPQFGANIGQCVLSVIGFTMWYFVKYISNGLCCDIYCNARESFFFNNLLIDLYADAVVKTIFTYNIANNDLKYMYKTWKYSNNSLYIHFDG